MTFFAKLRPFGRAVLNTLLPAACLACDNAVAADGQFCLSCFRKVNFISKPFCSRCGVPLPFSEVAGHGGVCATCEALPPAFDKARASLRYDDMTRHLILPFKYADRTDYARGLAILMARSGAGLLAAADCLVPVPLHVTRLRQRRYNQSALLATELGRLAGKPVVVDGLIRGRATIPLGKLGIEARRAEMREAISVRPSARMGKNILLIDDVMTSGTTANECAKVLIAAGAARVDVLTAARVPDPRLN